MKFKGPSATFKTWQPERERRAERRRARLEKTARVRAHVFDRAGARCELCGGPATDLHHRLGGYGRRTQSESPETCLALCRACHAAEHGSR